MADGGLGNQLFQLSFALYLADSTDEPIAVSVELEGGRHRHGVDGLAEIVDALGLQIHSGPRSRFLSQLALTRRTIGTWKSFPESDDLKSHISFGNLHIYCGYWQNQFGLIKYYSRVADACRDLFSLQPSNDSCLHVRLGDYQNYRNRKIYSQIDQDYYASALGYLRRHAAIDSIKVLTNDIAGAREMFAAPEFAHVEFRFEPGSPLDDFTAISESSALVASNSTFCWWGAFISARMKGLEHLVAPANWFNRGYMHRQSPSYAKLQDFTGHQLTFASF